MRIYNDLIAIYVSKIYATKTIIQRWSLSYFFKNSSTFHLLAHENIELNKEGGAISKVNIGLLITASYRKKNSESCKE